MSSKKHRSTAQLLSLLKAKKGPIKGKKHNSKITKKKNIRLKSASESEPSVDDDRSETRESVRSIESSSNTSTNAFSVASITQYLPFASVIVAFILPRFIKIDGLAFQLRLLYGLFLMFTAAVIKLIENRIKDTNDESSITIVDSNPLKAALNAIVPTTATGPLAGLAQAAISPVGNTTVTTKEYDLVELSKITNSAFTDAAFTLFAHFTYKSAHSLLFAVSRGIASLLSNQLVLIHIFGQTAEGLLARPFKSQAEQMVANINKSLESSKRVTDSNPKEISMLDSAKDVESIVDIDDVNEFSIESAVKKIATVELAEEEIEEEVEGDSATLAPALVGISSSDDEKANETLAHVNDALRSLTEDDNDIFATLTSNNHDSEIVSAVDVDNDADVDEDVEDSDADVDESNTEEI